jgi:hypothetical protein
LRNDSSSVKERIWISNKFRYLKPLQQYMDQYPTSDPNLSLKEEFCKEALIYLVISLNQRRHSANSKIESLTSFGRYTYNSCNRKYTTEEILSIGEILK